MWGWCRKPDACALSSLGASAAHLAGPRDFPGHRRRVPVPGSLHAARWAGLRLLLLGQWGCQYCQPADCAALRLSTCRPTCLLQCCSPNAAADEHPDRLTLAQQRKLFLLARHMSELGQWAKLQALVSRHGAVWQSQGGALP